MDPNSRESPFCDVSSPTGENSREKIQNHDDAIAEAVFTAEKTGFLPYTRLYYILKINYSSSLELIKPFMFIASYVLCFYASMMLHYLSGFEIRFLRFLELFLR